MPRSPSSSAIARIWSTAFVEPPNVICARIMFSSAFLVMIFLAVMPLADQVHHFVARELGQAQLLPRHGVARAEPGIAMPTASTRHCIVFAVPRIGQAPGPGQTSSSRQRISSAVTFPI